jgi:hypothetical protein
MADSLRGGGAGGCTFLAIAVVFPDSGEQQSHLGPLSETTSTSREAQRTPVHARGRENEP